MAVALLGGLAAMRAEDMSPRDVAYAAHRLEVEVLGAESGIQDQLSAALGGINYLEVDPYPEVTVHAMGVWEELSSRLTLVYLGRAHDSSGVHRRVIEDVGSRGPTSFSPLREAAVAARPQVASRDLLAFGRAMVANTEAQKSLHPELVGVDAGTVIEVAAAHGAVGLEGQRGRRRRRIGHDLESHRPGKGGTRARRGHGGNARYQVLPVRISPVGLEVRGPRC